jgi:hypothetical protein
MIFFLLPLSTRSFFFRKCFHENERERARQGAARKEERERESGLKKISSNKVVGDSQIGAARFFWKLKP